MNNTNSGQKYQCPLCSSYLSEQRYLQIIGVWQERKELEGKLKKQLATLQSEKKRLAAEAILMKKKMQDEKKKAINDAIEKVKKQQQAQVEAHSKAIAIKNKELENLHKKNEKIQKQFELKMKNALNTEIKKIKALEKEKTEKLNSQIKQKENEITKIRVENEKWKKQMERENKKSIKEAIEKGKAQEKSRSEKLAKMIENKSKEINSLNEKIKELQEQIKKGTTPQVDGLNLEDHIIERLNKEFPEDKIIHTGKKGDILHYIRQKEDSVGLILYECKKTEKFNNSFIAQTKRDMIRAKATYGVLVTFAFPKDQQGFFVEDGVIVVNPSGVFCMAELLRGSMIEMFNSKITGKELQKRAVKLMDYIKSDEFRTVINDNIYRTKKLSEMLKKEMTAHKSIWDDRYDNYKGLYANSQVLMLNTSNIIKGIDESKLISPQSIKQLPEPVL